MSCKFICDNCGKEETGNYNGCDWLKPYSWFSKNIEVNGKTTSIHACSRECVKKASEKYNTFGIIIPL